jgi:hypothetical protein
MLLLCPQISYPGPICGTRLFWPLFQFMPRAPSNYHPLQTIRTVIGEAQGRTRPLTQEQLGELLPEDGTARAGITIRRLEAGSLRLLPKLAAQITALTGVDTRPMLKGGLKGDLPPPQTLQGTPFTADAYNKWKDRALPAGKVSELVKTLARIIQRCLENAESPEEVKEVFCQLCAAIGSVGGAAEFELLPGIESLATLFLQEGVTMGRDTIEELALIRPEDPKPARARPTKKSGQKAKIPT